MIGAMIAFYPMIIAASMLVWLPFAFAFQLVADRGLKAMEAVKLSVRGVWKNLFGVSFAMLAISFVSFLGLIMCVVPSIFLTPIIMGAFFVLYRDIYGNAPGGAVV